MTPTAPNTDTIELMLESTLAADAIFFAIFTLLAALLNETIANVTDRRERETTLRAVYVERYQDRDLLDPQRQAAAETLRDVQRDITTARSRGRLLSGALIAVTAVIVVATFVLVYSYTLLDRRAVDGVLEIAFYVLMVTPLACTVLMVEIVRRLRSGD